MNMAVMASGVGTTFEFLVKLQAKGVLQQKITHLITDNPNSGAIDVARTCRINYSLFDRNEYADNSKWQTDLKNYILSLPIELILLLGYLRKIDSELINNFKGQIINIHPSLLPKFGGKGMYGRRVHEAVIKSGDKITGVTIHAVNANYDEGKILLQKSLDVRPGETAENLEARVKQLEKETLKEFLLYNFC